MKRIINSLHNLLTLQNLIMLLVVLAFLAVLIWGDSIPTLKLSHTARSTAAQALPPAESMDPQKNQEQTSGVIIGSTLLILIIIGGTMGVIRRDNRKQRPS